MNYWGKHLVIDAQSCNIQKANDPHYIKLFTKKMVEVIQMVPFGEPQVVHFAEGSLDKAGWTMIQLIETSNIMGHFLDHNGDLYLDVFSCKDYSEQAVLDLLIEWFSPVKIFHQVLQRDARR